ncbi:hypothetical protein AX16_008915 [Volvariella volvacea WC 439]|nr:hypothetical protein AX16_008915 [Volvariella volvacea WC 439]
MPHESEDPQILSDPQTSSDEDTPVASTSTAPPKKKKKKSRARGTGGDDEALDPVNQLISQMTVQDTDAVQQALEQLRVMQLAKGRAGSGEVNASESAAHKFWATQPVPQPGEGPPEDDGYIEPSKPVEEVRQTPYALPKEFEWSLMDIVDTAQVKEVYDLLSLNYVEDDDASFRFQYSAEFLQWALTPPGYYKEWHIGVRVASNKKLVAFISGIPVKLRVRQNIFLATEINFLCVHKKLRSKRLAPVLIKEVTRQVHLKGIFQAIYTAGVVIPTPVSTCQYYHRSLNIRKLVDIKFTYVPRNMTIARMTQAYKVPSTTLLPIREMEERDLEQVASLFSRYMTRFGMVPVFTLDEMKHHFLSGRGHGPLGENRRREGQVVWTYVVEDPITHQITDFFSFYSLPSTVINNREHGVLEAAYLYYYATSVAFEPSAEDTGRLKHRVQALIGDALVVANQAKFDVLNALTLMDNVPILHDLKFGVGDGRLNFYLYNWRTAPLAGMEAVDGVSAGKGVGVVML